MTRRTRPRVWPDDDRVRNWAGNIEYRATRSLEPTSIEELQELVRGSSRLRVLGSRHSFNDIADTTGDHVSLARLPRRIEIDPAARTVTVDGGIRYRELCEPLDAAGFALHNLASLPHISIAGASATGTHGSGDRSGGLGTAVAGMEIVTADGEMRIITRQTDANTFNGAVVSLGSLGVVVRLTLDIEPTYEIRQDVYEDLPLSVVASQFEELVAMADSVSLFTEWRGPTVDMVWLKRRVTSQQGAGPATLFGARQAAADRHPIRRMSAAACTPQLGVPGPWFDRLPHFRMDQSPSAGDELQSEYLVPREYGVEALSALDRLRDRISPLILVSEVRTVAADSLWLSMAFGRASVAFHFTWKPDWEAVRRLLPDIEAALRPFEPRPHWGKLFTMAPDEVRDGYERMPAFQGLVRKHDPTGKFRNDFIDRLVFGGS